MLSRVVALVWIALAVTGGLLFFLFEPTGLAVTDTGLEPMTFAGWLQDGHLFLGVAAVGLTVITAIVALVGSAGRRTAVVIALAALLAIAAFITGLLLPFEAIAFWSITTGTDARGFLTLWDEDVRFLIMGGVEVGPSTLRRWLITHLVVAAAIPVLLGALVAGMRSRSGSMEA